MLPSVWIQKGEQYEMRQEIQRPVRAGLFLALALSLHLLETMILPLGAVLPLPGVRLGLANLVSLVVLGVEEVSLAWWVMLGRVFLAGLISGTFMSLPFFMGLAGGIASLVIMTFLKRWVPTPFSWIGLSVIGALCHNFGQLFVLYLSVPTVGIFAYLPWMIILSVPSGIVTGSLAAHIISRVKNLGDK
jgi:heptaprenyl diphosphate synthase